MKEFVKCKVLRNFSIIQHYEMNEEREFTKDQTTQFSHLIEPINSTDESKDKMYKEGKKKGKKKGRRKK